jgi:hypothetical protein
VFTTCGASFLADADGRRAGQADAPAGPALICAKDCKTVFAAHYLMDSSTAKAGRSISGRVAAKMDRLVGKAPSGTQAGGDGMIPVLDFTRFSDGTDREGFVADLGAAARGPGFFLLKGHGIDGASGRGLRPGRQFFALPVAHKEAVSILKTPHYRGWAHDGLESLDETSGLKDRKESFNIGFDLPEDDPRVIAGEPFRGVNQWPDLPGFATRCWPITTPRSISASGCRGPSRSISGCRRIISTAPFTTRWRRCACCTTRPRPAPTARSGRARIRTTGS